MSEPNTMQAPEPTDIVDDAPLAPPAWVIDCSKDTVAIVEAIYALAGEVRALRNIVETDLAPHVDRIVDAVDHVAAEIPSFDGALQVEHVTRHD